MSFLRDEEIQRNGIVICIFNVGKSRMGFEQVPFIRSVHKIRGSVPMRLLAAHYCYDDPLFYSLMVIVTMFAGSRLRARFKAHYGMISISPFSLWACASRFWMLTWKFLCFSACYDLFNL